MEIVDAQVHLNQLVSDWKTAAPKAILEASIAAMDAVGIDTLIIAEARGYDANMRPLAGPKLANGATRFEFPFSELAAETHPGRLAYVARVDPIDPEMDRVVADLRTRPGVVALRIIPFPETGEVAMFERGEFSRLFAAAEKCGLPVFTWLPGRTHLLVRYLKAFPQLQFILDHCGVGAPLPTVGHLSPTIASSVTPTLAARLEEFKSVLDLAQYPNLAMKWSHAPSVFSSESYPFQDVLPLLRRAIEAFGVQRLMWASDYTQVSAEMGHKWAETLYYVRDSYLVSDIEKEWLLGRTARTVLNWARSHQEAA